MRWLRSEFLGSELLGDSHNIVAAQENTLDMVYVILTISLISSLGLELPGDLDSIETA